MATATQEERRAFFDAVLQGLEAHGFELRAPSNPWIEKKLSLPDCGLYCDVIKKPMYLGFYCVDERAKKVFHLLQAREADLQTAFTEPLVWRCPGVNGQGCNVILEVPFRMQDAAEREQAALWVADRLRQFDRVFERAFQALDTAGAARD